MLGAKFAMADFRALSVLFTLLLAVPAFAGRSSSCDSYSRVEHTKTFVSPGLTSRPGDVNNKFFTVDAPTGHFVTVDFNAELLYENGEPVPLTDVYLHHWVMFEVVIPEERDHVSVREVKEMASMNPAHLYNGEIVGRPMIKQAWAKGGETRHLNSSMPSPYGMVSGGDGVKTRWMLNVHGIDTRGAMHRMACTECRCDLFTGGNRTDIPDHYPGGLRCCGDESRCKLRDDFNGDDSSLERIYHLKYTWTYAEYDECVIPLTQMGLDVTVSPDHPRGTVEYDVEGRCEPEDVHKPECVDVKEITVESKLGGDMVYVVSHLHAYSLDSTLYGEDGRLICQSSPIYGHGKAAGDEKGYVVGISHCNPSFGSNGLGKIRKGEKLRYQVKYTKVAGPHTGVMGVLFIKIAEETEIITTPVAAFHGNRKILN